MAEYKVWLLFGGLNFGISSSKCDRGHSSKAYSFVCFFTFGSQFQTYQIKDFTFPKKTFLSVFWTRAVGNASPRMGCQGILPAPAEPTADQYLQIPFCRAALSFSYVAIRMENKWYE